MRPAKDVAGGARGRLLAAILGLRWRLFWARARSRNAKIALGSAVFLVGWIALMLAMGAGGVGAVAARFGKPTRIADFAFGIVFVCALAGTLAFGLDSPSALSDEALRRYPLTRRERQGARFAAGLFDPLWLFVFAVDIGISAGFVATGAAHWWIALPEAALLFLTNYLSARLLVEIIARIMALRGGPVVLLLGFVLLLSLPGVLLPAFRGPIPPQARPVLTALKFTPPLAAAAVVVGARVLASLGALLVTVGWLLGISATLFALEGRPIRSRAVAGGEATWDSPYDRVAAMFGPTLAPLAGKTLRYYVRGPLFALNYLVAMIAPGALALLPSGGDRDPLTPFLIAVAAVIPFVSYGGIGIVAINSFGYDRSGFGRYFLLPVSSRDVLSALAFVPLLLNATLVPLSLLVFVIFWHGRLDARMLALWLAIGFAGLLVVQAVGLRSSLFSPHSMPLELRFSFGKRQPAAYNALRFETMLAFVVLLIVFHELGSATVLAYWWVAALIVLLAAAFYLFTLRRAGSVLRARREQMLKILERSP